MEPEVPQEPQDQPAPEAPQPQIDPRAALEIAAQQYGVTPEELESSMRLQDENRRVYEENRRRARELEVREAQIEALARERQRYMPPEPQFEVDPAIRPLYEKMAAWERRQEERERREEAQQRAAEDARRKGEELHSHYQSVMRLVPTQNQMDPERFFAGMAELWPDGPPAGISAAQAVERTARYLGIQTNGAVPQAGFVARSPRDPRAQFVVPMTGSAQPTGVNGGPPATGQDFSPQKPNESTEQYHQRLLRGFQEMGTMKLPDGAKVSSGW